MYQRKQGWPFDEDVDIDEISERRGQWRVEEYKPRRKMFAIIWSVLVVAVAIVADLADLLEFFGLIIERL